jgi:hypothetical protein
LIVATACAAVVGAAGCSGPATPVAVPSADSSAPAPDVSPAPVTAPGASSGPSSPSAIAVVHASHACAAADLAVTVVGGDGAGGSAQAVLRFRNIGPSACSLRGYPTVLAVDAAHHASLPATHSLDALFGGTATVATIDVAPGRTASATLEWGDNPVGTATTCTAYPTIEVTPPGTRHAVRLRMPLPVQGCTGVSVLPVVAGARGTIAT